MKLIIKEEKYDLSWKEHDIKMRVDGVMGTYPSYAKKIGNVVVNIDPEVFSNGEFGYTVYYTPHIGQAGFKKAESGFINSSEAMDYADTHIFGDPDFENSFWESKSKRRSRRYVLESPTATIADVDTYIIPNVDEDYADEIINFAYRSDNVQNCEWDNGQMEIKCDPFIFQMILLWAYRKGFVSTDKRMRDILRDNRIEESLRPKRRRNLKEQDVEIEVKNKGILEVPEGKNVDDLPMSHFEKLVKKHGLSKITKALNNLQVWNKNDDKKLSKWAGDMIDKLTKKYGKNESRKVYKESSSKSYWKYSVLDPVFYRNEDDDTYLSKYDIRRVKLIPCNNPDECYDGTYSAVCDYEYPYDEFYGTKQDAYDMLITSWNNSTFERIHDI